MPDPDLPPASPSPSTPLQSGRTHAAASLRWRPLLGPALALAAVAALAAATFLGGQPADERAGTSATTPGERRDVDDPLALGDVDAPVVLVEFSDYQCPYCGRFAREVKPQLIADYVAAGVLRLEWRDLPLQGERSYLAAAAARAAAVQGGFELMHDALFAPDRDPAGVDTDRLVALADELGLDPVRFATDLEDAAQTEAIDADRRQAEQLGVNATPTVLIGDERIVGAQPLAVFTAAVEAAAAAADGGR